MFKKFFLSTGMLLTLALGFTQLGFANWVDQCTMPSCAQIGLCARSAKPSGTCYVYSTLYNVYPTSCGPCYGP